MVDSSPRQEAERNDARAGAAAWAGELRTLVDGEPTCTDRRTVADTDA